VTTEVRFTADMRQWDEELTRLGTPLTAIARLEEILHQGFEETQRIVHVITGSLRGSGKTQTEFTASIWTGEIIYGGDAPGFPFDPVEYAEHERGRGGDHDFYRNLDEMQSGMMLVVTHHLEGP
jgi:hypothetical protein